MQHTSSIGRRTFMTGLAAFGTACLGTRSASAAGARHFHLGVASYSLRKLSRTEAISMIKRLGVTHVNIKSFHLPYEASLAELAAGRGEIEAAGLKIVGGGTISLKKDEDADVRQYFEYAKNCGMPLMVIAPRPEVLPRIERFVKEYDIRVAIHNHGPEDNYFPRPVDGLNLIKNMDPRVGLCIDVGHTVRTGVDVVEAIAEAGSRLLDMHVKDLRSLSDKTSQCAVGEGAMPVEAIFGQLQKMGFSGYVNLEYEIYADNPLPGMKKSFGHMREVLKGLES